MGEGALSGAFLRSLFMTSDLLWLLGPKCGVTDDQNGTWGVFF